MKFMILMSAGAEAWQRLSAAEQQQVMARHDEFRRALEAEGKYVMSQRLGPADPARTVRLDEAVEWAKRSRFITGWNEVRALADG